MGGPPGGNGLGVKPFPASITMGFLRYFINASSRTGERYVVLLPHHHIHMPQQINVAGRYPDRDSPIGLLLQDAVDRCNPDKRITRQQHADMTVQEPYHDV